MIKGFIILDHVINNNLLKLSESFSHILPIGSFTLVLQYCYKSNGVLSFLY